MTCRWQILTDSVSTLSLLPDVLPLLRSNWAFTVSQNLDEDDQLMIRLQEGDSSAFDEIVDRHSGPLYGFFLKNSRNPQLAEDLTQETLLRLYRQFWNYLPVGRFKGWMYRIARNLLIDNVRKASHDCLVKAIKGKFEDDTDIISTVAGDMLSPQEEADHGELKILVDRLLDDLPEEQRLTFTLHHFAGLSLPEVAEVLDTSVPTTKSRLRLAREKLSSWLLERGIINPHQPDD
jgi:RNA polymerase sigma-70 factor, ECF subfamily